MSDLKKRTWPLIFIILLGIISPALLWAQKAEGPKMIFKEASFDFKEVQQGEPIEHEFQVFNVGNQTLKIRKVRPG